MPVFGLAYEEQAGGRDKGLRLAGVYKLSESFWGRPFLVNGLGVGAWYDLTDCRDELLEVEEREEALLQWAHSGKTGEGGRLPLALATRIDNQSFSNAA